MRRPALAVSRWLGRLAATLLVVGALAAPARATDPPADGPADAAATAVAAILVPATFPPVGAVGLAAGPLPGGSIPFTALPSPPARGDATSVAGELLLQAGGGGPRFRYYGLDALGSVRVVFDEAGQIVGRADYEPFGAAVPASTTGALPRQQFTGQERDGEVGVDYFGARMYIPQHGRMPSVDPLYVGAVAEPQRWNRYAYALNTPTAMVDPDGRCTEWTSDNAANVCGTGGNASYTHPAYIQEHHPFLFLLMGYSNYGYSGGGSVTMPSPLPPPAVIDSGETGVVDPGEPPVPPPPPPPPPPPVVDETSSKKSLPQRFAGCVGDQLGFQTLLGGAYVAAGQPIADKPFVTPNSSTGTNWAGKAADKVFGNRTFPVKILTVTGGPAWLGYGRRMTVRNSAMIARVVGRTVPWAGWYLLAYDAVNIGMCTF